MGTKKIFLERTLVVATLLFFACGIMSVQASWTAPVATPPNANKVLNFGGGAFEEVGSVMGSVIRQGGSPDYDEDFVFGSPQIDDDGDPDHAGRMFFDESRGAFRAGYTNNINWNEVYLGDYSAAFGFATAATGGYSFATGYNSISTASAAHALGYRVSARADHALTLGAFVRNEEADSVMIGFKTTPQSSHTTDPGLFVNSSNNVGIGTSAIDSGLRLDVAGRVGASHYCNEDGTVCTLATDLGSGGGGGTYGVIANQGLRIDGSNNFGLINTCSSGQLLKWNGSSWACSNDDTGAGGGVTSLTAGNGLTGGGTGAVTINAVGGTGVNVAADSISFDCSDVDGTGISCSGESLYIEDRYRGADARCSGTNVYLDGDGNCDTISGGGDNLGNHSATQNLDLNNRRIVDVDTIDLHGMYNGDDTYITIDEDLDMSYNWIRDARLAQTECRSWVSSANNVICPTGFYLVGVNAANDWVSGLCCRP
jgi:hypothetical protein